MDMDDRLVSHDLQILSGTITIWFWWAIPDRVQEKLSGYALKTESGICVYHSRDEAMGAYGDAILEANRLTSP